MVKSGGDTFRLRVEGESMIDALISDGDLVIMEHVSSVDNGEMAAVRLKQENETTLKRFFSEGPIIRLQPANSQMDPLRVSADNVEVLGKVVAVWRYFG